MDERLQHKLEKSKILCNAISTHIFVLITSIHIYAIGGLFKQLLTSRRFNMQLNISQDCLQSHRAQQTIHTNTLTILYSFIYSGYFYSAFSSPLLLRGIPDTARILCRSFTPKRYRQLRVKDLPMVPTWRLEQDSNP